MTTPSRPKHCITAISGLFLLGALCCTGLTGCTQTITPGHYDATEIGKVNKVVPGTILSKRPVRFHTQDTGLPSAEGGAPAGDAQTHLPRSNGFEYVIRLNTGAIISVVQAEDLHLAVKQPVLVIYGTTTRVVADEGSEG